MKERGKLVSLICTRISTIHLVVWCVTDEAKVLEQVIRDTEQISLDDEPEESGAPGELGEGGEVGGVAPLIEPGSAAAILEDFITRLVGVVLIM